MRKFCVVLVIAASGLAAGSDVTACGDKFLYIGRGTRFGRAYAAIHPASIVIYASPSSPHAAAMRDPQLVNSLKQAGHRVSTVVDVRALSAMMNADTVDVVIADLSEATAIDPKLAEMPSRPTVLPVLYRPSKEEAADATKRYPFFVKAPDSATHLLNLIDDLMNARSRRHSPVS